jgi:tetratricopeptide (TPR) repeat protein
MNNMTLNIKSLLLNATQALRENKFIEGKKILEQIQSINSNILEVNYNLAILNLQLGNLDEAIIFFTKAKKINPKSTEIYLNLGIAYDRKKEKRLAIQNFKKVIELEPNNAMAYCNLGTVYKDILNTSRAEENLKKSLNLNPNLILAFNNLFDLYDKSNQSEKFSDLLSKAKKDLDDKELVSFFSGVHQYKKKNYQKTIDILESSNLENYVTHNINKASMLAKSYDQVEKFDQALKYFKKNNELVNINYGTNIDENFYTKYVDIRINFFENFELHDWQQFSVNDESDDPIFLIGFPRSGTTLLDSIFRTNENVEVIEEKPIVKNFLIQLEKKTKNKLNNIKNLSNDEIKEMRNFYFNERDQYIKNKNAKIIIDKLPLNVVHVGEILRFFPNSKFVFALRHPYDSVLSCFMQQFELNPAMKNFLSIKRSAYLYDLVMKLWKTYLKIFPINFHYIKYEDVVTDFEKTTKKIFKFLNLDWSNKAKDFYKTAKDRIDISTPSYNQVTSPLYLKSMNRWKNYEENFNDVKNNLQKWIHEFEYKI